VVPMSSYDANLADYRAENGYPSTTA